MLQWDPAGRPQFPSQSTQTHKASISYPTTKHQTYFLSLCLLKWPVALLLLSTLWRLILVSRVPSYLGNNNNNKHTNKRQNRKPPPKLQIPPWAKCSQEKCARWTKMQKCKDIVEAHLKQWNPEETGVSVKRVLPASVEMVCQPVFSILESHESKVVHKQTGPGSWGEEELLIVWAPPSYHPSTMCKLEEEARSGRGSFVTEEKYKWTSFASCDFATEIRGWGAVQWLCVGVCGLIAGARRYFWSGSGNRCVGPELDGPWLLARGQAALSFCTQLLSSRRRCWKIRLFGICLIFTTLVRRKLLSEKQHRSHNRHQRWQTVSAINSKNT